MPKISRTKGNRTNKFGQLIECNIRNSFLKNHAQNVVEELVLDPFLKSLNWTYLRINSVEVLYSLLLLYGNLRAIAIYRN